MLTISVETRMKPDSVIKSAVSFFQKDYGLKVVDQSENCASMVGGGGTISITSKKEKDKTSVEVITQEWDDSVKEFMRWLQAR